MSLPWSPGCSVTYFLTRFVLSKLRRTAQQQWCGGTPRPGSRVTYLGAAAGLGLRPAAGFGATRIDLFFPHIKRQTRGITANFWGSKHLIYFKTLFNYGLILFHTVTGVSWD